MKYDLILGALDIAGYVFRGLVYFIAYSVDTDFNLTTTVELHIFVVLLRTPSPNRPILSIH